MSDITYPFSPGYPIWPGFLFAYILKNDYIANIGFVIEFEISLGFWGGTAFG